MSTISNDEEMRMALDALPIGRQREVGARFVESVIALSSDARVPQALAAATDPKISEEAMGLVRRSIKAASLEAHTRCGADGEWSDQAGYFVARAAEACVEPSVRSDAKNLAWKAAMNARMARTCLAAEGGEDAHGSESHEQYKILARYLDA